MKISQNVNARLLFIATFLFYSASGTAQTNLKISDNTNSTGALPVTLSISKNSEAPGTDMIHVCVLKAVNVSDQPVSLKISAINMNCEKKNTINMEQEVYWTEQGIAGSLSGITGNKMIPAHGSLEFNVRLIRPLNTPLNTWNCTEVKAIGANDIIISNSIVIETFIPDPKDFR